MKRHPFSLLLAAALAGCTSVPYELRDGPATKYTSTKSPRDLVDCIVRNQARNGFALTPALEERDKGELMLRLRSSEDAIHFQALVIPLGIGSAATVRTISVQIGSRIEIPLMDGC